MTRHKRKWEATKGKHEATTASNLGGNRTESSIVRGHKWRTIGERKHRARTQANTLSGNKTRLALRSLEGKGILTGGMSMRAEWREQWWMTHGRGDGDEAQV
jgi:hypothetical protein